jgi:hypothetical protein
LYHHAAVRNPDFCPAEKISRYHIYKFTPLLLSQKAEGNAGYDVVVDFIGPNCQRLKIRLLTARQDPDNPALYYLTGKAKVLGHLSSFSGTLALIQARELRQLAPNGDAASAATMQAIKLARREDFVLGWRCRQDPASPEAGFFGAGLVAIGMWINTIACTTIRDIGRATAFATINL